MKTWIFQGNPKKFNVDDYLVENKFIWWAIRQKYLEKDIKIGDQVFIWRSDGDKRFSGGVVARCEVTSLPQQFTNNEHELAYWHDELTIVTYLAVKLQVLEVEVTNVLSRVELQDDKILSDLPILKLRQNTNYLISDELGIHLYKLWQTRITILEDPDKILEGSIELDLVAEQAEEGHGLEGGVKYYYGKHYERNAKNRKAAIEIHGLNCFTCGFNFEEVYGERGKDFIEVHHIKPLSTLENLVEINPETDLVPLCANCHRMVHRRQDDVWGVEDLKRKSHKY